MGSLPLSHFFTAPFIYSLKYNRKSYTHAFWLLFTTACAFHYTEYIFYENVTKISVKHTWEPYRKLLSDFVVGAAETFERKKLFFSATCFNDWNDIDYVSIIRYLFYGFKTHENVCNSIDRRSMFQARTGQFFWIVEING